MNRTLLIKAADLAEAASTYATLTASHAKLDPERAARFAREVEATLYAALDALAMAQLTFQPEQERAAA